MNVPSGAAPCEGRKDFQPELLHLALIPRTRLHSAGLIAQQRAQAAAALCVKGALRSAH